MIRSFAAENYLSLRNISISPGRLNVLVGPNMSGKSNLLDAFRFLHSITTQGLAKTLVERGGFTEILWKGQAKSEIVFRVVGEMNSPAFPNARFNYEIKITGGQRNSFLIESEALSIKRDNTSYTLISVTNGKGELRDLKGVTIASISEGTRSALEFEFPDWIGMEFKNWIRRWQFFSLIPQLMKKDVPNVQQDSLAADGSNFSSWLMTLQTTYEDEFQRILKIARDVFPELEKLTTPLTANGNTAFSTRERSFKKPVSLQRMSDGEVVFLGLLSILYAPENSTGRICCIEEPENHLHPKLLDTFSELLTGVQSALDVAGPQIFITTHSMHLIDKMKLEDLLVFQRKNGETKIARPSTKQTVKDLLNEEKVGLGDLLYSGSLNES